MRAIRLNVIEFSHAEIDLEKPFRRSLLIIVDSDGNPEIVYEGHPRADRGNSVPILIGQQPTIVECLLEVESVDV